MSNKDKKIIEEQDKLLDHLIEYGGHQYIQDEMKKYEDLPELDPSKEFDDKMHQMFQDAYKKEARREHLQLGKKIAVIAVAVVAVASAAAMNIKAVREPVLNFVFKQNSSRTRTNTKAPQKTTDNFSFKYIPDGYTCTKKQYASDNYQSVFKFENKNIEDSIYIKIQSNQKYDNYISQTQKKNYEELTYNNKKYYFLSSTQNTLMFFKQHNIFSITSSKSQKELLKIAENIRILK